MLHVQMIADLLRVTDDRPGISELERKPTFLPRRLRLVPSDIPVDLPRGAVDADELRRSPEYAELRIEVGRAVKAAAA